jgi:hypothetical protein
MEKIESTLMLSDFLRRFFITERAAKNENVEN